MAGQLDEQVEFGPGERDLGAVPPDRPAGRVDVERAERQVRGVVRATTGPSQGGSDASDEFRDVERLLHVVVRAGLQADDDVERIRPRGEHDHRHGRRPPDLAADLQPVEPGQHDVQQDEVEAAGQRAIKALDAVGGRLDREAGVAKADGGDFADGRIVLDEQDPGVHSILVVAGRMADLGAVCQPGFAGPCPELGSGSCPGLAQDRVRARPDSN